MNRMLALVVAAAVAVGGMSIAPRSAGAVVPGAVGRIAFHSDRDSPVGELYTREFAGGAWTRLTSNTTWEWAPAWSPDGSKIAYGARVAGLSNIWLMGADGSNPQNLTKDADYEDDPDWSPDGSQIVYASYISGISDIWVVDADGSGKTNLTPGTVGIWDDQPAWSPDGTTIAFVSTREGSSDIHVMDASGNRVANLTRSPTSNDGEPTWSPDGSKIAFVSNRVAGVTQVFVMGADGSGVQQLTSTTAGVSEAAWSPDGDHILFTSAEDGDSDVWMMDPDGSNVAHLSDDPGSESSGAWESVNREPIAVGDGPLYVRPGGTLTGSSVLVNDSDPDGEVMTARLKSGPAHAAAFTLNHDGSFVYVHDGSAPVADSFAYAAVDARSGVSNTATVSIRLEVPDTVGLVDPSTGVWRLRNGAGVVTTFYYGNPGDAPFVGDWDCSTTDTPGLYRQSDGFAYLRNTNSQGIADVSFFFGNPGDVPLAGDFNGDGCDTVSIYRPSEARFYIINQLGQNGGGLGAADYSFLFGDVGDMPVVGDWDGDGIDEVGLHRESTGFFYYRNTLSTGTAHGQSYFGDPGDRFVAGDWGYVDGTDSPGLFRPSNQVFYFRHNLSQGAADSQFKWADAGAGWLPVAGDFNLN